ncbi:hypothetical protein [Nocardia sp. NPDC004860]|uniref:hypothetical protein n=1 Tax=Nocardia sp. NPDC004860 TaxID=3154557 RepID=UPI0033B5F3E8
MSDDPPSPNSSHRSEARLLRQPTEEILVPSADLQVLLKAAAVAAHEAGQTMMGVEHVILALLQTPTLWPHEQLTAAGLPPQEVAETLARDVIPASNAQNDPSAN